MRDRVMVIGIDGATFDIILPMVQRGELPNIASFMEEGAWAALDTTVPPVTVPAWVSCVTGKNPGKLGVYFFTDVSHTYDGGRLKDATDVKAKSIWHLLTDHGKKSIAVAVPFTYPPAPVNGVIISDITNKMFGAGNVDSKGLIKTHPPGVAEELAAVLSIEESLKEAQRLRKVRSRLTREEMLENASWLRRLKFEKTKTASLHLLKKHEWDFFMTVFSTVDGAQHHFMGYLDPTHRMYTPGLRDTYGERIYEEYRMADSAVGEILRDAPKDVTCILVSDHGGAPIHNYFYSNVWLKEMGLLKVKGDRKKPSLGLARVSVKRVLSRLGLPVRTLPNWTVPVVKRLHRPAWEEIDWERTKAYSTIFGISINLKGREPRGIVPEGEYDRLCEQIREALLSLKGDGGQRLVDKVYRREEAYSGPYVGDAPDIVYLFKDPRYLLQQNIFARSVTSRLSGHTAITGQHTSALLKGIFLMKGPGVKPRAALNSPHIMDVAPTALYAMGLEVPCDMDGRVLTEAFRDDFVASNPPAIGAPGGMPHWEKWERMTGEEEELVKRQLKQLGYME